MVFNEKKQTPAKPSKKGSSFHESAVTILTPGCHFNGKLFCRGSSRIGGKIEGEIISEGLLIIEESAEIIAKVKADEAIIQGHFTGRLEAVKRVELTQTARFEGDIITPSLVVKEGAQFNGNTTMVSKIGKDTASPIIDKLLRKDAGKTPKVGDLEVTIQ